MTGRQVTLLRSAPSLAMLAIGYVCVLPLTAAGQGTDTAPSGLSLEQQSLANRFERLEAVAARLAELADEREPERAEQLRRAIKASREQGVTERFRAIVALLEQERLSAAARDQVQLQAELESLLQVLLEDPGASERDAMKRFLQAQIRELGKLIREQRSLGRQTDDGADGERLADRQGELNGSAEQVQQALESNSEQPDAQQSQEGQPSESESQNGESQNGESQNGESQNGQPQEGQSQPADGEGGQPQDAQPSSANNPIDRSRQRVEQARQAMEQAEQKLRDAERRDAREQQREAQRELEAARAELERVLRQLREEEMERLLAKLAARFRDMLAVQQVVYDDTTSIAEQTAESATRNLMLQAIRLSRREADLVREAEKALTLLREDGTSVAFPETTEQIADDMRHVTGRLAAADVGPITQTVELDIIAGLQDMIEALDRARDELAQQEGQPPPGGGGGGSPGDSPLVSKIAELRMIRTLQARIYKRTQDLGSLADNPQVESDDLAKQLSQLAIRQDRVFQATRDLDTDANR